MEKRDGMSEHSAESHLKPLVVAALVLGLGVACASRPPQNLQRNWPGVIGTTVLQVEQMNAVLAALEYRNADATTFPEEKSLVDLRLEIATVTSSGGTYWSVCFVPRPPNGETELRPGDNRREIFYMVREKDFKVVEVRKERSRYWNDL